MKKFSNTSQLSGVSTGLEKQTIASVASEIAEVVKKFINRHDVQNGRAIGYKRDQKMDKPLQEDTPRMGVGQGLGTTGWCASASAALLKDPIFQNLVRQLGASAKLVSIDIKEMWYGKCYNGIFNKWHTAILVEIPHFTNLIVDITCSQFSSDFIGKYVWDFKTWEATFRSPYDKHNIVGEYGFVSPAPAASKSDNSIQFAEIYDGMHDVLTLSDMERKVMTEYFTRNMHILNAKRRENNMGKEDFVYQERIVELLDRFPFKKIENNIGMIVFDNEADIKKWYESQYFVDEETGKNYLILDRDMFFCNSVQDAFDISAPLSYMNLENYFNVEKANSTYYFVSIELESGFIINTDFINKTNGFAMSGLMLEITDEMKNGGLPEDETHQEKPSNTYFIKTKIS